MRRNPDDNNPLVHPGAEEVPDGVDEDCDGVVDEGTGTGCGRVAQPHRQDGPGLPDALGAFMVLGFVFTRRR